MSVLSHLLHLKKQFSCFIKRAFASINSLSHAYISQSIYYHHNLFFGWFYSDENSSFEHFGVAVWECYMSIKYCILFLMLLKDFLFCLQFNFVFRGFSSSSPIDFIFGTIKKCSMNNLFGMNLNKSVSLCICTFLSALTFNIRLM